MDITNKKILVTGGAGFIGSHTVDALIAAGARVVVIDNLVSGRKENLNPQADFYPLNIADPGLETVWQKALPEIVYHFAGNILVPQSVQNPLLEKDGLIGTINLLQAAKKFGVKKIIFSSTEFVYGNGQSLPFTETDTLDLITPYTITKAAIENYLRFYNRVYNLPYVVYRYATAYGPRQTRGAMTDYIRKLARNQQAEIWGDGEKTREYLYVSDIVSANLMALDVPDGHPDPVFNLGTGVETSLNALYKKIAQILGKKSAPIYLADRAADQTRSVLDSSKIQKLLGWRAQVDLDTGLKLKIEDVIKTPAPIL